MHSLFALLASMSLFTSVLAVPVPVDESDVPSFGAGNWTVVFYDNFTNSATSLSTENWVISTGTRYPGGPANWGNGEVQEYTSSATNLYISSHSDGSPTMESTDPESAQANLLNIVPQRSGSSGSESASTNSVSNSTWTSGRIETSPSFNFVCPEGGQLRMEARFKLGSASPSAQQGIWPAFWALGTSFRGNYNNWPAVGEIDIFETVNGDATSLHTVHCGTNPGGPCNEPNGLSKRIDGGAPSGQWITASVTIDRSNAGGDWRAESLKWRMNGKVVNTLLGSDVGDKDAWAALAHDDHFLLLNVAVGGALPNAMASSSTPMTSTEGGVGSAMQVSHVAVLSRKI
ncbi:hypothetical protein CFIMG_003190RAa [Ceratocystis fimbriata CBS 114723]|uniref:GH16 domain-containing protein n=1 Tax=Ceratocystis fimbriata CBS 114723 TaxID=1035309 RepID=A0A2C5WN68_9PEZI|nr:hypothetical protein CFIMG_003190RAa [Ceratocystis fimbriata CBS 114723]